MSASDARQTKKKKQQTERALVPSHHDVKLRCGANARRKSLFYFNFIIYFPDAEKGCLKVCRHSAVAALGCLDVLCVHHRIL